MEQLISDIVTRSAQLYGDKIAVDIDGSTLTFAQLDRHSDALASAMVANGLESRDRVTLWGVNSWQWLVAYYGCLKAGAVVNPVNGLLTPDEVAYIVSDCGSRFVFTDSSRRDAARDALRSRGAPHVMTLSGDDDGQSFDDLLGAGGPPVDRPAVEPTDVSTICYTSGTTGFPKGAMLSHRAVVLNAAMTAQMHARTSSDVVLSALPFPHVYGNVVFNSGILCGATGIYKSRFVVDDVLEDVARRGVTIVDGVPTMYFYLVTASEGRPVSAPSLTRCTVGGQSMPEAKIRAVEELFGCPLLELWGMTEIAGLGTTHPSNGPNLHGSIGTALPYTAVRVADIADPSQTVPDGEVGELVVKGPTTMMGYYCNDQATQEVLSADGWLRTGDLARADDEGRFFIVDRKKDMILTAGYNVYPAEIERVLAGHPAVSMVAVGAIHDDDKGELARAYVVLKPEAVASPDELVTFCRDRLAAYKVPRSVVFVTDLPKTSTGKITRRALAESYESLRKP